MGQLNARKALEKLKEGNRNFCKDKLGYQKQNTSRRAELAAGQEPFAVVLGCADSRVVPELVFDVGLGEIFVVRVAGNIANTSSIASIEYAIQHLNPKVNLVVVLGHEGCGAVKAALGGGDCGYHLNMLLAHLQPAVSQATGKTDGAKLVSTVKKNARLTAKRLGLASKSFERKSLEIVPAYYNLASGKVDFL
jgi:carbonic anhydrase